jgi:hypothetical protein
MLLSASDANESPEFLLASANSCGKNPHFTCVNVQ